jgi:hypothetical protein
MHESRDPRVVSVFVASNFVLVVILSHHAAILFDLFADLGVV